MAKKHNIIVVGNGLFGSIAATYARSQGHTVTVVSEERKYSASKASGCVLAPSWLSSLDKHDIADAMAVLEYLYTVHPIEFQTNVLAKFKAHRVDPDAVLIKPDVVGQITSVADGSVKYLNQDGKPGTLRGTVLVAAGIWSQELVTQMPPIKGLYGCSLRIPGQLVVPRISVYEPYRQAVGFQLNKKEVWFGDGTALIAKTWDAEERERVANTTARASDMVGAPIARAKVFCGARPYVEGHKSGYLERLSPKLWVSTGGAKNGTVLAALQALRFEESLT
jgi:glycine/D-amino acid oxidase-like deaminating enzyme